MKNADGIYKTKTTLGGDDMSHQEKCSQKDVMKMSKQIKKYLNTNLGIAVYNKKTSRYYIKVGKRWVALHKLVYLNCYGDTLYGREIHHKDGNRFNNYYLNLVPVSHETHKLLHKYDNREKKDVEIIKNTWKSAKKDSPVMLTFR